MTVSVDAEIDTRISLSHQNIHYSQSFNSVCLGYKFPFSGLKLNQTWLSWEMARWSVVYLSEGNVFSPSLPSSSTFRGLRSTKSEGSHETFENLLSAFLLILRKIQFFVNLFGCQTLRVHVCLFMPVRVEKS